MGNTDAIPQRSLHGGRLCPSFRRPADSGITGINDDVTPLIAHVPHPQHDPRFFVVFISISRYFDD